MPRKGHVRTVLVKALVTTIETQTGSNAKENKKDIYHMHLGLDIHLYFREEGQKRREGAGAEKGRGR